MTTKQKLIMLFLSYALGTACILTIYLFDFTDNILLHTLLFTLILLMNRFSYKFTTKAGLKTKYSLYATEALFLVYILISIFLKESYFAYYKLLLVPPFILSLVQMLGFEKQKKKVLN